MLTAYMRHLCLKYLVNLAARMRHRSTEGRELVKWVLHAADRLSLPGDADNPRLLDELRRVEDVSADDWERLRDTLAIEYKASKRVRADRTGQRIRRLGRDMRLSRTDVALLELLLCYETQPVVESMIDDIVCRHGFGRVHHQFFSVANPGLAHMLGISMRTLRRRLAVDSPLVRSGLVSVDDDGDFKLMQRLLRLAHAPAHKGVDVRQLLFDKARAPELEWSDFDHVADNRNHVERLVAGALESGERGVNVLLYGPPGTGKTQFCRTLAHRLGVTMYSVGEADERGCEPSRGERLQELRLAQRVLGGCRNSILLFDEMEDLLADPSAVFPWFFGPANRRRRRADGSRVFLHRLLEENKAPTLWTTNAACQTSEAVLRRMMYALELRRPSPRVRERIWTRQLKRHGIPSEESDARALAREFDVTPGVAAGATAAARLIDGGDIATVRHGVRSLSRLLHGEKPPQRAPGEFDPRLIRTRTGPKGIRTLTDPVELADRLAELGAQRVSLCLQGPPGSGKSAFVRYLAERIGLEVMQKRASDLMSKWVGDTEKVIAAAFAGARDNNHFLVFDEADSLLSDRRFAHRSWEISQVNEMLTWMESHPLPFACTTNFGEHLDPATLRRFDFKLRLDYLTADQAVAAFRVFFGLDAPATVRTLSGVTPGDFAVVRRRAEILGKLSDANSLAAMLQEECDAKPNRPTRIGFGVHGK